ncbi:hypothetical protein F5884DRAFT_801562 [Xylogone sp. PMI_703]|nr:hypothetical protein F5884DRAFT_801562 [Xylogone sp. PMI_703]
MAHFWQSTLTKPADFNFAIDVLDYWATTTPKAQAMIWLSQDMNQVRKLRFTYFQRQSHRIAVLFRQIGIKPGQVVLIITARIPAWWEIAMAAIRSNIVLSPATALLVDKDIQYRCLETGATTFIGDAASIEKFNRIKGECPSVKHIIQVDGDTHIVGNGIVDLYSALKSIPLEANYDGPKSASTDRSLIYFTSGTSGPPKMVQHNHVSYPLALIRNGKYWLQLEPGKVYWNLSEQGWAKAAWSLFSAWNCGAALFIHDDRGSFDPIKTLDILHEFPITTLCAPPTVYRQLVLEKAKEFLRQHPPRSLTHCTSAGEPLNGIVIDIWQEMTGLQIYDGYGQTETVLLCGNLKGSPIKPGSMGKPIPGVPLHIISPTGEPCGLGAEGDIAILLGSINKPGDSGFFGLFDGYLSRDGKLNRRIVKYGSESWFLTGDRATKDSDGYFWFVGRADDVINSAGYRIGPFEVESALRMHPNVVESAVVSSPDSVRGEVVKAFVVLADKQYLGGDSSAIIKELQDFCKEKAAPYKYPRKIQIVDASFLPKTVSGKIKRSELRAMEWSKKRESKM